MPFLPRASLLLLLMTLLVTVVPVQARQQDNSGSDGPDENLLFNAYAEQVMLAVRPNWGFASAGRVNLSCVVRVKVDMQGKVLQAEISQSSGNSQYDASAVNAVIRTKVLPAPPTPDQQELLLTFNTQEMMGRR